MEVQCTLDGPANKVLQERFQDTLKENTKLNAELTAARKEIKRLKKRLKEIEVGMLCLFSANHVFCVSKEDGLRCCIMTD